MPSDSAEASDGRSAARRRVLIVIKGLGIGGAEKLISEGARHWDRDRFDYHVAYVLPWKNQLVPDLEALGIGVSCLGGERGRTVAAMQGLQRLVRRWSPDLMHVHSPSVAAWARFSGVPIVYTEHNLANSYRTPTAIANRVTYGRNRAVIAVSGPVAESLEGYPGPTPELIENGVGVRVDPEAARVARSELRFDTRTSLVVHVGNIRPYKGHGNLIAAAAILARRNSDVQIVSIGGEKHDGDLARVRRDAEERGAAGTIRFLGRRADALSFVAACDVFVNPADVEGLPVAVLEALDLNRPVVATAVGGVPSIVRDRETGLLVPPGHPEALADAIELLVTDRRLASDLAAKGKALIEQEYSLATMVSRVEAVYAAVLGE